MHCFCVWQFDSVACKSVALKSNSVHCLLLANVLCWFLAPAVVFIEWHALQNRVVLVVQMHLQI